MKKIQGNLIKMLVIVKKSSPKNLSADCRYTVGQLSAGSIPTVNQQLTNSKPTLKNLTWRKSCWCKIENHGIEPRNELGLQISILSTVPTLPLHCCPEKLNIFPLLTSSMKMVLNHPKSMKSLWNFTTKIVCVDKGGLMKIKPTNHLEEVTKTLCCWCNHQCYRLFLWSLNSGGTTD